MNLPIRIGVVALVLGAFGGAIAWLSGGETARADHRPDAVRWESSAQCRDCHQDVYDEWFGSHHRIAYTNPEVRDLSDDFRKEECMDCHLPRPLAVTGFGKRTLPRRTHFDEGVSCISCHLGPDGGILARNDRPVREIKMTRIDESTLGALFMHFMIETILAADLIGVDPFDQPAVEQGKVLTREYMARSAQKPG